MSSYRLDALYIVHPETRRQYPLLTNSLTIALTTLYKLCRTHNHALGNLQRPLVNLTNHTSTPMNSTNSWSFLRYLVNSLCNVDKTAPGNSQPSPRPTHF